MTTATRARRSSSRLERVTVSPLFGMLAEAARRKAAGRPVIALTAGEPDFDTPTHIIAAAKKALDAGHTRYTPVAGTPTLKAAIVQKLRRDNDLVYAAHEVIATTGAKQALFNFCLAALDPGDEVIISAPYWPSYVDMVRLAGATEVVIPTRAEEDFVLQPDALRLAMGPRTRAVFFNSPCNPSGACYTREDWLALGDVLRARPDVLVVSDEIYEHIRFTDGPFVGLLNALPDLRGRSLVVNGVSKSHAMTGWRIGFAAGPEDLIGAMEAVQSHSTSNPCAVAQSAAAAALAGDQACVYAMAGTFAARHAKLVRSVNSVPGLRCRPAGGAFYLLVDVRGWLGKKVPIADDVALTHWLLDHHDLALAAGTWFGAPGYLRCSFAAADAVLVTAVERLRAAAAHLLGSR